ncbi:hypothetical protein NS381_21655 [Pantoea stewartii]|nr:hypothetical protein NS381_21655 [Pantoea stewartii]
MIGMKYNDFKFKKPVKHQVKISELRSGSNMRLKKSMKETLLLVGLHREFTIFQVEKVTKIEL